MIKWRKYTDRFYRFLTGSQRTLPDFLIIGAQKAGTTSLHFYLKQHPQVFVAPKKEVHFFDSKYHRGIHVYRRNFLLASESEKLKMQGRHFIQGESSTSYLLHPMVPQRVKEMNPDMRLIVVLRDPKERTISHYKHNVGKKREKRTFGEAIRQEESLTGRERENLFSGKSRVFEKYKHYSYIERSVYQPQLDRWYEQFPKEQLLVLQFDDLINKTEEVLEKCYKHLGIDSYPIDKIKLEHLNRSKTKKIEIKEEDKEYLAKKLEGFH